ncbi:DDE-type integrase/transposase/recombinase [Streptomyces sp. NPDC048270]|uniref:DDE-type integrase/transposase/recombinase n=1 Tax=Streptomyces sp. NPDC048270 TaxID=3154615 RepID=UPI0033EA9603
MFQRDFTAVEPGRKYRGDITYLPLEGGKFLYPATVLDCFSRKIVGWSIADHMRTTLVADALRMAAGTCGSLDGAVFHSDHRSRAYASLCDHLKVTQSMGRQQRRQGRLRKLSTPPSKAPTTTATPPPAERRPCLADPLQHPPPTLRQRLPQPRRIRTPTPRR